MKHFLAICDKLKKVLAGKTIFLFLDYDGTLAPLVDRPGRAFLTKKTKRLLINLAKNRNCKVAIVSGRRIKDIKKRVRIKKIIYVGNHGLEIYGPKIKFEAKIHPKFPATLSSIKEELNKKLSKVDGAFVEDKGLTLSLHYRCVNERDIPDVKTIFHETVSTHLAGDKIKVKAGKMVFEVRPPITWDKGKAILWLLARQQFANKNRKALPFYFGDDTTDEDAFRALRKRGITVFVGSSGESHAEYYLKSTQEVARALKQILKYCSTIE